MKKLTALALVLVMVLSLAACGLSKEDVSHRWSMIDYYSEENARENLEAFGFYDSEIALADLTTIGAVRYLTFTQDGKYSYKYDDAATEELLVKYYDAFIANLYQNRASLVDDYSEDIMGDDVTAEDFQDFYAYMFDCETYEDMLHALASDTFDFTDTDETGTYKIEGGKIAMSVNGTETPETVGIKIDGTTLTVTYADGDEVYTLAD